MREEKSVLVEFESEGMMGTPTQPVNASLLNIVRVCVRE